MRKLAVTVALAAMVVSGGADAGGKLHHGRGSIGLSLAGTFATGIFGESAAEIPAYDAKSRRLFVINAGEGKVDVLDMSDPANMVRVTQIAVAGTPNSVAVHKGLVAVAVEAPVKTDPGAVEFYDTDGNLLKRVAAGALPDMVTFTPNGKYVLAANEGEPNDDYSVDPEGSITIINLSRGLHRATAQTADFGAYNAKKDKLLAAGVRIFGPGATVAQDVEPEYIAVAPDSRRAWVSLQENNAFAVVDIRRGKVIDILPLGVKDHSIAGNGLDASDKDDAINIANWPVYGMYQPDSVSAYNVRGRTYIVSANEGDTRDYDAFSEEARVKDLTLDPTAFPDAAALQENENLGRLTVTNTLGDADGDGDFDKLYVFGGRSFSIWSSDGKQVYDSGDAFERIIADAYPDQFNSNEDDNDSFDSRSDNKGPEPEGLAIAELYGRTYVFIGLERMGGVMVYDITDPRRPDFVEYVNNRDFSGDPEAGTAGDLAPEGLIVVPAKDSPTHKPLLVVANEVSGTTSVYTIDLVPQGLSDNH
jgi:DNA-binding beta-propeller fold protein YncE